MARWVLHGVLCGAVLLLIVPEVGAQSMRPAPRRPGMTAKPRARARSRPRRRPPVRRSARRPKPRKSPISMAPRPAPATAQSVTSFKITSIFVWLPQVDVWVDVRDGTKHVNGLSNRHFKASVGNQAADVVSVTPTATDQSAIAYVLALDASGTMKQPMPEAKKAAKLLIGQLRTKDRMALIRFGSGVRSVVKFTSDKKALIRELDQIKATDRKTHLYEALKESLSSLDRLDPKFPRRRVIIVISDGLDDGSGITIDDLKDPANNDLALPVMFIQYSRLRGADRQRANRAVDRIAHLSRGKVFRDQIKTAPDIVKAFQSMLGRLKEGYSIRLNTKVPSGGRRDVEVLLNFAKATKSSRRSAQMLGPGVVPVVRPGFRVLELAWYQWWPVWTGFGAVVLLLVVVFIVRVQRRKEDANSSDESEAPGEGAGTHGGGDVGLDVDVPDTGGAGPADPVPPSPQDMPVAAMALVVARGSGQLQPSLDEYYIPAEGLVLGRTAEIRIVGDHEVSASHCRFTGQDGRVLVEDLDSSNGTLRNGAKLMGRERLEEGDTLELGSTTLRYSPRDV